MNQSQFYNNKCAVNELCQRLILHPNNILFVYDTNVNTESGFIPLELIERIVNTSYYYLNIYNNCCLIRIDFMTPLHAVLYFDGETRGKQDVFINYFELYKNWFESQDKLEELTSYTKTNEYKLLSDKERKIKALEERIQELLLEKSDINEYSIQQEHENQILKNTVENLKTQNNSLSESLELDQAELKNAIKCCIKYDNELSKLKSEQALSNAERVSTKVANSCMDYREDYEILYGKMKQISDIVFGCEYVEKVVNDSVSDNKDQKSKITDYYKPLSDKPPLAPKKPTRLSISINEQVNTNYFDRNSSGIRSTNKKGGEFYADWTKTLGNF